MATRWWARCPDCATSGPPAAAWAAFRRAARSARCWRTGWSRAIRAPTSSAWTSRAMAASRATTASCATGEPGFVEAPTLRRSAADRFVAAEVAATRTAAGLLDTGVYARYEVSGPGAGRWLDHLLASRLPEVGRIRLAPMLNPAGRLMGDLTVTRLDPDRYWLVGSYYLQEWHLRWFREHLPASGVEIENLSESWLGFSLSGPRAREILAALTPGDVSARGLPFIGCASVAVAGIPAVVARLSLT